MRRTLLAEPRPEGNEATWQMLYFVCSLSSRIYQFASGGGGGGSGDCRCIGGDGRKCRVVPHDNKFDFQVTFQESTCRVLGLKKGTVGIFFALKSPTYSPVSA